MLGALPTLEQCTGSVKMPSITLKKIFKQASLLSPVRLTLTGQGIQFYMDADFGRQQCLLKRDSNLQLGDDNATNVAVHLKGADPVTVSLPANSLKIVSEAYCLAKSVYIYIFTGERAVFEFKVLDGGHLRFYMRDIEALVPRA